MSLLKSSKESTGGMSLTVSQNRRQEKPKVVVKIDNNNPLAPIDVETVLTDNQLLQLAEEEGKIDFPKTDSTTPIGNERLVDQIFEQVTSHYHKYATDVVTNMDEQMNTGINLIRNHLDKLALLPDNFEQELSRDVSSNRANIDSEKQTYDTALQELREFKQKNGLLNRNCTVVSRSRKLCVWLGIPALIVLEAVMNAGLFSTGLDGGYLEGISQAALASALNVVVAVFFGRLLIPYKNCVQLHKKLFGYFACMLWLIAAVIIALSIAHYRDALQFSDAPAKAAIETLLAHPFQLADFFSWLLFGLTLIIGFLTICDIYGYKDPYPGYTEQMEKFNSAKQHWTKYFNLVQGEFDELRKSYLARVNECITLASNELTNIKKIAQTKQQTHTEYEHACDSAVTTARTCLQRMRSLNARSRTTAAPAFYQEDPCYKFEKLINTPTTAEEDLARISEIENQIQGAREKAQDYKKQILNLHSVQVGVLSAGLQEAMI